MRMMIVSFLSAALMLSGCAPTIVSSDGASSGRAQIYRIGPRDEARIRERMVESVNALRGAAGMAALQENRALVAAAQTHSRDMSLQNRPWHFGSDGSSPLDRVARSGFAGQFKGELISETYETELETLAAWMDQPATRRIVLDPTATDMGFAWQQDSNGKIWWTLVTGRAGAAAFGES